MKQLYIAAMLEKFSFNGMSAMLVLYMVQHLNFTDTHAFKVFSAIMALGFITPLIGGWMSDRMFNKQQILLVGAVLMACGFYTLLFTFKEAFYLGLSRITIGSGFIRSSIPDVVGTICKDRGLNADSAFTTLYVFINVGTWLGAIGCGMLGEMFGWNLSFVLAGTGMLIFIPLLGFTRLNLNLEERRNRQFFFFPLFAIAIIFIALVIYNSSILKFALPILEIIGIYLMISITKKQYPEALGNVYVLITFMLFQTLFFALYNQENLFLILFAGREVKHSILSISFPTTFFQTFDPAWNIIIGTILTVIWHTRKRYTSIQAFYKFLIGLFSITLGFVLLAIVTYGANDQPISPWWMIISYGLFVLGELCIIPIGLSLVGSLTPRKFSALFMAIWYLSLGFSMWLAGVLSSAFTENNYYNPDLSYEHMFRMFSALGISLIFLLFITISVLKKINFKEIAI